jgi:hypothetical protein
LIEGSHQTLAAKPTPRLTIGLIGSRDRGDQYVTQIADLTDDLDAVYGHLRELHARGGGDKPESINQARRAAVKAEWHEGESPISPSVISVDVIRSRPDRLLAEPAPASQPATLRAVVD